jgi:hypothetical protein
MILAECMCICLTHFRKNLNESARNLYKVRSELLITATTDGHRRWSSGNVLAIGPKVHGFKPGFLVVIKIIAPLPPEGK